jgi:hypothetical protein
VLRLHEIGGGIVVLRLCVVGPFVFFTLLTACSKPASEQAPIQSLEQSSLSSDFDAAFWQQEAVEDSEVWKEAVSFCIEEKERPLPNCSVVLKTAFIQGLEDALDRPFPEYPRDGGGSTGVPKELEERLREVEEGAEAPDAPPDDESPER